jgi:hypothetical protein
MGRDVKGVRLSVGTKLLYGFGSVAYGVKDGAFKSFLLIYYNQVIGLPAGLVASAILLALVADSLLDPLIGQLSDGCVRAGGGGIRSCTPRPCRRRAVSCCCSCRRPTGRRARCSPTSS